MPTGNFQNTPFAAYNRDIYGLLGNVAIPGQYYGCQAEKPLSGINKTGTFLPFGKFVASTANLETSITKKTGIGNYVPQLVLPTSAVANDIKGVTLYRELGNWRNDQNAWILDGFSSQPQNGGFAAYYANEMVTYTSVVDKRGIWVCCDGTAPALDAPIQIVNTGVGAGNVSATGAVTLTGKSRVLSAPVSLAGTELAGYLAADNATHAVLVSFNLGI